MTSIRRSALQAVVALLVVALTIPGEALRPDPAAVAAAGLRPTDTVEDAPPAAPGTYRSASSAASVPITAIDIALPSGTTTNDVLLAMVSVRGAPTITPPAGWILVRSDTNGTVIKQSVYQKVATASEPTTYTFTFNLEVAAAVGIVAAYSGVDTTTPVDVSGGQTGVDPLSWTPKSWDSSPLQGVHRCPDRSHRIRPSSGPRRSDWSASRATPCAGSRVTWGSRTRPSEAGSGRPASTPVRHRV